MKKALFFAPLLLLLLLPGCTTTTDDPVETTSAEYFVVTNSTGYPIYSLRISPATSSSWGEDVLGDSFLPNENYVRINLSGYESSLFDILAVDSEGNVYEYYGLDVSTNDITISSFLMVER